MENPFTLSFGREPLNLIDRTIQKQEVIDIFDTTNPSSQVCMITGVRGSGKTVLLTELGKYFRNKDEWIVIDLTPERDLLNSLAAELYNHNALCEIFRQAKLNLSFLGIGVEIEGGEPITDLNVAIRRMLNNIKEHNKKVLVTIDEAVCNKTMKEFASVFQIYVRQELPVFLLMSGLYDKIYELQNEETLTFLYRAPKVELKPLNIGMIAERYRLIFKLDESDAVKMARETMGYSFAFQVLGYLCWKRSAHWSKVLAEYSQYLEEYVYDKLWTELSPKDKDILIAMAQADDDKVKTIREKLGTSSNLFSIYRERLIRKGVAAANDYGRLDFALPRFKEFVLRFAE